MVGFVPGRVSRPQQFVMSRRGTITLSASLISDDANSNDEDRSVAKAFSRPRRMILSTLPILIFTPVSAQATTGSIQTSQYAGRSSSSGSNKIKPQAAFEGLVKAREELQYAQKFLQKKDYEGLREYLEGAENINAFEPNALAILSSKKLE